MNLEILKPKKNTDNNVYITKDLITIDFEETKIHLSGDNELGFNNHITDMESFFSKKEDKNLPVLNENESFDILNKTNNIKWIDIPFTKEDNNIFNSIASIGESLFWYGYMEIKDEGIIDIVSSGIIYHVESSIRKMIENNNIKIPLSFSAFWYIYKASKDFTKKKPGVLKIGKTNKSIFLTFDNILFIEIDITNKTYHYNKLNSIKDSYKKIESEIKSPEQNITNRLELKKDINTYTNHLLKALGDGSIILSSSDIVSLYKNKTTKIFINKEKK